MPQPGGGRGSLDHARTREQPYPAAHLGDRLMRDRHNDILHPSRRELMAYAGAAALTAGASLGSANAAQAKTRFVFANESDYDTVDPHAAFDVGRVAVRLNIY